MHPITLHLTDAQAEALQAAADRRTLSVEEMAVIAVDAELYAEERSQR